MTDDPIRVDWVDLKEVPALATAPGRLGMTFLPGKHDFGRGGFHRRDLDGDVGRLRDFHRVDAFLLLNNDHELRDLKVPNIAEVMADHEIELIRHPIPDGGVPADRAALRQTLDGISARLAKGETIAVACRGGLGRTGTVVGCLLCDGGLDATAAIELTRRSRDDSIENVDQERFVENWAER